jgi:diguanylate cyclase (GGDEF)-like protein
MEQVLLRAYNCVVDQHNLLLVGLAAVLCAVGSHATFTLLHHAAAAGRPLRRHLWTAATAFTAGTSVWATHFLALLAFKTERAPAYDLTLTIASLLVAVGAMGMAGGIVLRPGGTTLRRAAAGTLLGLGIGAMHYTGMAAYRPGGTILWDGGAVAASVVLGAVLAAAAMAVGAGPRANRRRWRAGGALLLTLAICSLHFTGMSALLILPDAAAAPVAGVSESWLVTGVGFGGFVVTLTGLAGAALDRRERRRAVQEMHRMHGLADAAIEGLLICEGPVIVASNSSMRQLLGRDAAWFARRRLGELFREGDRVAATALTEGETGRVEELELIPASGEPIPAELISRRIFYGGQQHHAVAVRDLRARRQAEERIRFLAHHDPLTTLPNRTGFAERLARVAGGPRDGLAGRSFALLALDLDRFKIVNDTLGHAFGDALLVKAAARLRAAVQTEDLVSRLGGDEFAVVQFVGEQPEAATRLAERLLDLMSRPFLVNGQVLNLGTSIGIALYPEDGADIEALSRNADLALYRAKADGGGTYRFFESAMDTRMQRRRMLEVELRTALAMRQFRLLYQPQLSVDTEAVVGFEALIRWAHPERGLISPSEFIPLAEETGLIVPIGEWVLREACREAAGWRTEARVSVNVSPVQFRSLGLVDVVRSACAASGLDPRRLELEITEGVLMADTAGTLATLRELKAFGVAISMDDFGTGYSSLSYLRSFPFDKIKIDRSFVTDLTEAGESAAIVRAIIALGRSLGMQTTVEGVETAAQLAHVRSEGCDQVQGYLIGRPLPPEDARALLDGALARAG